jgi:hypothetical protein
MLINIKIANLRFFDSLWKYRKLCTDKSLWYITDYKGVDNGKFFLGAASISGSVQTFVGRSLF